MSALGLPGNQGYVVNSKTDLLQLGTATTSAAATGISATIQYVQDGAGTATALGISTAGVTVNGVFKIGTSTIIVPGNVTFGGTFSTGSTFSTTGTFSTGGNFSTSSTFAVVGALSIGAAFTTTAAVSLVGAFSTTAAVSLTGAFTTTAAVSLTGAFTTTAAVSITGALTTAGALTTVGAFATTLTMTNTTTLTLPTTGTLATLAGAEVLSNKTLTAPVLGVATATSIALGGGTALANYVVSTWTPIVTLVGGAGNTVPVYTDNVGVYTRIGNVVYCNVTLNGDGGAEGAGTGAITISLPISASALNPGATMGVVGGALNNATRYLLFPSVSTTTATIFYWASLTTYTQLTGADQNNATRSIALQFWYYV